ncbi:hypothetical protein EDM56_01740 [Brevibacillus fluminis]|uniref:Poly(3-hydroxyalkanoate) polymerase subunit PhaE n=2 Tax=Brevibacillus fluminis TaxID=511487 RepID=A0A3M8DWG0_9BACL|nr:hypothetical protein EDM56_01740 [Brevibacillus fluminis]
MIFMQTPNYMDPFSIWKSMYTEMEPTISKSMQKWLESDEYAAFSGQLLTISLQMEQTMRKHAEQLFQTYNVPTKSDLARIMDLLIGLEAKVDAVEERLVQIEANANPPQEIRDQLSQITNQLDTISVNLLGNTSNNNRKRAQKSEDHANE